jgi:hypothetical protein
MLFSGNGTFIATEGTLTLSTVGFRSNDQLLSFWSQDGGTTLNSLGTHSLNSLNTFVSESFNLPSSAQNLADITLVFRFQGDIGNDNARVDNVLLTGVASPVPGPIRRGSRIANAKRVVSRQGIRTCTKECCRPAGRHASLRFYRLRLARSSFLPIRSQPPTRQQGHLPTGRG